MSLVIREYSTVSEISGPLLFVQNVSGVGYGELVRIRTPAGEERRGQVLEVRSDMAVVQVFEGTSGLPETELRRVDPATIKQFHPKYRAGTGD